MPVQSFKALAVLTTALLGFPTRLLPKWLGIAMANVTDNLTDNQREAVLEVARAMCVAAARLHATDHVALALGESARRYREIATPRQEAQPPRQQGAG
jgi:hypothetical protein